jgi:hypothetical protein
MKAVALYTCCAVFMTSLPCTAEVFGDICPNREAITFSPGSVHPTIAKWLLTLPEPNVWVKQTAADATIGQEFAEYPIGGEFYHLMSPHQPGKAQAEAAAASGRQMLDATPIGDEPQHGIRPIGQSQIVTQKVLQGREPEIEGRSASKSTHQHSGPVHRWRVASGPQKGVCRPKMTAEMQHPTAGLQWRAHYRDAGLGSVRRSKPQELKAYLKLRPDLPAGVAL